MISEQTRAKRSAAARGPRPGAKVRPLEPEPHKVYPDAQIRALKWSFPDDLAAKIQVGQVIQLQVVARIDELRDHNDGPRWNIEVLEVSEASE